MSNWLQVLGSAWLSLALTLFFGCLSVYFFLKSRGYRRIVWTYALASVQTKAHPDIEIAFRGEPIRNLTRLLVLCWNDGTKEIRPSDIPSTGPPRISFDPRLRVLSTSVVGLAIPESGFTATITEGHHIEVDSGRLKIAWASACPPCRGTQADGIRGTPSISSSLAESSRITYPAAHRRFAPITMPWSP